MLPATISSRPALRTMWATRFVVVVLPFEPVMATIVPGQSQLANSSSEKTGTPVLAAATSGAESSGTPGLTTRKSASRARPV